MKHRMTALAFVSFFTFETHHARLLEFLLLFKTLELTYFFFELEPEREDPDDWPRDLKTHNTNGEEAGQLGRQRSASHMQQRNLA